MPKDKCLSFYQEVTDLFLGIGFTMKSVKLLSASGICPTMIRGGLEYLYCHPMDISGIVTRKSVELIAAVLRQDCNSTFTVRTVDIINEYVLFTPDELRRQLEARREEFKAIALEKYRTTRSDKFRIGISDLTCSSMPLYLNGDRLKPENPLRFQLIREKAEFMKSVIGELVSAGLVIRQVNPNFQGEGESWNDYIYRTANKKELRELKKALRTQAGNQIIKQASSN